MNAFLHRISFLNWRALSPGEPFRFNILLYYLKLNLSENTRELKIDKLPLYRLSNP